MQKNAEETYYMNEEGKNFKDWTKAGLEFLLNTKTSILTISQVSKIEKKLKTI